MKSPVGQHIPVGANSTPSTATWPFGQFHSCLYRRIIRIFYGIPSTNYKLKPATSAHKTTTAPKEGKHVTSLDHDGGGGRHQGIRIPLLADVHAMHMRTCCRAIQCILLFLVVNFANSVMRRSRSCFTRLTNVHPQQYQGRTRGSTRRLLLLAAACCNCM